MIPLKLKNFWTNFLSAGIETDNNLISRQIKFMNASIGVGIPFLTVFAIRDILLNSYSFFVLEIFTIAIMLLQAYIVRYKKNIPVAFTIFMANLTVYMVYTVASGGYSGLGVVWIYIYPPLAYFIQGSKKGFFWVSTLSVIFLILYFLHGTFPTIPFYYSLTSLAQIIASLFTVTIFVYLYTSITEKQVAIIDQNNKELEKQRTQVLQKSEELQKFYLAVEQANDHILITDENGKVLYANKSVERITGYKIQEVLGNSPNLWGGLMSKSFYEDMWNTIKTKKTPFIGEIKNKRKNGEEYFASVNISPLLDKNNNVKFFVGIERDISREKNEKERIEQIVVERTLQLKEKTQALDKEHTRLLASIESLKVGFIMVDINYNIILINRTAKYFINSAQDKNASAKNQINTHNLENFLGIKSKIEKTFKEIEQQNFDNIQYQDKFFQLFLTPVTTLSEGKKQLLGCAVIIEDITEEKLLDRSRDEFFSIASHELRTPLTAIRGNSSMIEQFYSDKIKNPELKEMIGDIHESSSRLIGIVNDFLDLSRLQQGRMQFEKQSFDIGALINDTVQRFQTTANENKIYIKYEPYQKPLPMVFADKDKTTQVLTNLIGNSLKFTTTGGVTIKAFPIDNLVKIQVADTGRGIPKENISLLFRKFQQAGTSLLTRDTTKGTGLGLYISKLIIEGMGGEINLEKTEAGKGSTFSFTLPVQTQEKEKQLA